MDAPDRKPWIGAVILVGVVYFGVGFVFAVLANSAVSPEARFIWRLAAWMQVNGEAIFGTRPWKRYGEGPAAEAPLAVTRNRVGEQALGHRDREVDGVRHQPLVHERRRLLRQVVLLVREVEDAQRRDPGLRKREVVGACILAELRDDLVALRQPELRPLM